jgi:glycosyltransferase involved in cell wall biosynthesis
MEAMASGIPAVVSDVGDLRDLVEDGVNGYIVTSRAPEDFADRILELLDDDGLRARFGRAAEIAALRNAIPATATRWETLLAAGDPGRRTRG